MSITSSIKKRETATSALPRQNSPVITEAVSVQRMAVGWLEPELRWKLVAEFVAWSAEQFRKRSRYLVRDHEQLQRFR
ncbi:hypothetical protein D3C86_1935650 [compost metagenome]